MSSIRKKGKNLRKFFLKKRFTNLSLLQLKKINYVISIVKKGFLLVYTR
jgi:hypothetical protein